MISRSLNFSLFKSLFPSKQSLLIKPFYGHCIRACESPFCMLWFENLCSNRTFSFSLFNTSVWGPILKLNFFILFLVWVPHSNQTFSFLHASVWGPMLKPNFFLFLFSKFALRTYTQTEHFFILGLNPVFKSNILFLGLKFYIQTKLLFFK